MVVAAEAPEPHHATGHARVLIGLFDGEVLRDRDQGEAAWPEYAGEFGEHFTIVSHMLQQMMRDQHVERGIVERDAGRIDAHAGVRLMQVGANIERVAAHQPQHVALRREVQDALAVQREVRLLGDQKVLQPVPLPAAATRAPAVEPKPVLQAEEPTAAAADRTLADELAAATCGAELPAILQEALDDPSNDLQAAG